MDAQDQTKTEEQAAQDQAAAMAATPMAGGSRKGKGKARSRQGTMTDSTAEKKE